MVKQFRLRVKIKLYLIGKQRGKELLKLIVSRLNSKTASSPQTEKQNIVLDVGKSERQWLDTKLL